MFGFDSTLRRPLKRLVFPPRLWSGTSSARALASAGPVASVLRRPRLESLEDRWLLAAFHVSLAGNDAGAGSAADPFRTIQRGVNAANSANDGDDMVLVEGGTYNTVLDGTITIPSGGNIDNLLVEGGYVPGTTFASRDPVANPTNYQPAAAAGDRVRIQDNDVTIRDILFQFDGTNDGVLIEANSVGLEGVSVTGAVDGIRASGRDFTRLISVTATGNTGDGVDLQNAGAATVITGGNFTLNGDSGVEVDGAAGSTLSVDASITATANGSTDFTVQDVQFFLVDGTNGNDAFSVSPSSVEVAAGPTFSYAANVDNLQISGLDGDDTFVVRPSTTTAMFIDGGNPVVLPGDRLSVNLAGLVNPVLPPAGASSGTVSSDSHENVGFTDIERFTAIGPDAFEENNSIATATVLGSLPKITLRDLTIHETFIPGIEDGGEFVQDVDFYKITAQDTGKLIINAFFDHELGDLDMNVRDMFGNVIASSLSVDDDEQIIIPVVTQEMYFLEVFGVLGATNSYALEIENFPAPVPSGVHMDPASDSGMMNNDLVTADSTPRLVILADLFEFNQMGITVLTAAQAAAGVTAGAAVEVFVTNTTTGVTQSGFANPIGASTILFDFTPTALADGFYFAKAAVRIFDGQQDAAGMPDPAQARSLLSEPLWLTIDTTAPNAAGISLEMLTASDSGTNSTDNVTNKMQPAFQGVAEAGAKVRLYADGELVGQGIVGSDTSDVGIGGVGGVGGAPNDGLGLWEITVEPLVDGQYQITIEVEDLAGNVQADVDALEITVDALEPQRPTVDLVGMDVFDPFPEVLVNPALPVPPVPSDTGMSTMDDVTRGTNPLAPGGQGTTNVQLRISAEPGSEVRVKDGEMVIATFIMPAFDFVFLTVNLDEDPHPISVEAFDLSGNRSHQSEELLVTIDVTPPATPAAPDLIASSDTGMFSNDNVTSKMSPAFTGVAEKNTKIRVFATNVSTGITQLVGQGTVNSDETDGFPPGTPLNGLGTWEVTVEPMADAVYDMFVVVEDLAGNISSESSRLRIEIDSIEPNTPFLDLIEVDDSGRHNDDNVTNVNEPRVTMTSEDPNLAFHQLLFEDNLKFRIFDRFESSDEFLLYDSSLDAAADAVNVAADGFTALLLVGTQLPSQFFGLFGANGAVTAAGDLADGIHNLKLEVEDRAGNISHDFLFDLLIDTVAPPVSIIGIDPALTDTGVEGFPATFADRVTSDTATGFVGRAEADAIVRLYADAVANGLIGTPAEFSLTVAVPLDGDDAFPNGQWDTHYIRDLNDPNAPNNFPFDGVREILVTAEDLAGNVNQVNDANGDAGQVLRIFLDTQGPQVTDVDVNNAGNPYDLFDPKPSEDGPTPLVERLVISVRDLPFRSNVDPNFLYDALFEQVAEEPGHYLLVGDHNGVIAIQSVNYVQNPDPAVNGQPSLGTITLDFFEPLPDDRFTLTISDAIVDPAGNALDGETNTIEPQESPLFPTGDGQPGGDFVARFTVDTRPEIGVWSGGSVYVDTNGNFIFDPEGKDNDDTNEDITYVLGFTTDDIFAGNFTAAAGGVADDFDKLAAYGRVGGNFRWLVDTDNDGVPNIMMIDPAGINGLPVAGNFDGNDGNGDEVGVFTGTRWHLDTNHDFQVDTVVTSALRGLPIVGDFDGDGLDDLATYNEPTDEFQFDLAAGGFGAVDVRFKFGFPGIREYPVATDMNQDGFDDVGLFAPDRGGMTLREQGEWYFLLSSGEIDEGEGGGLVGSVLDRITVDLQGNPVVPFTPEPFGNDLLAQFGDEFAVPVVGNFDPPVSASGSSSAPADDVAIFQNPSNPLDVNGDSFVSAIDALQVINDMNRYGSRPLPAGWSGAPGAFIDVTGDGILSPLDALRVINRLNAESRVVPITGSAGAGSTAVEAPADDVWTSQPSSSLAAPATSVVDKQGASPVSAAQAASDVAPAVSSSRSGYALAGSERLDEVLAEIAASVGEAWQDEADIEPEAFGG